MATRMQQRRGTAAQWISTNQGNGPILSPGEIGWESDTNKFKIGDGVNHWIDLTYFTTDSAEAVTEQINAAVAGLVDGAPGLLNTLNELAAAINDDPTFFTTIATNLSNHESDTTGVHGIADTSALATKTYADNAAGSAQTAAELTASNALSSHNSETTNIHGIDDTSELATKTYVTNAVGGATVDQSLLAGVGIDWNAGTEQFDIDSTVATKTYADGKASDAQTAAEATAALDATTKANTAENNAKSYADGLAVNYDAAGSAITAENNAKAYTDLEIAGLVDSAPALLDTLNELAAALGDSPDTITNLTTTVGQKVDKSGDTMTGALILSADPVAPLGAATKQYVDNTADTAQTNAESYADGLAVNYDAVGSATTAENNAKAYADVVAGDAFTDAVAQAQTFATDAYNNATGYADGVLGQANGYTDSAVGTEVGNRNLAISDALITAQGYASTAETNANFYTDGAISGLSGNVTAVVDGNLDVMTGGGLTTDGGFLDVDYNHLLSYYDQTGAASSAQSAAQTYAEGLVDTHESDTTTHGTTSDIVGKDDIQTLTNKTISYVNNTITVQVANVSDLTATATELNYVDGVTSAIQTQLDDKAPLASPTFTGNAVVDNLEIGGALTFSGTATQIDQTNLTISDPLIYLAEGNTANINDLGFVASYNDGTYAHTGLAKDASAGVWKLFKGVTDEPTNTVNFTQGSLDDLQVAGLVASSITVGDVSNTEIGYLNGVTSAIQTQIDGKQEVVSGVSSTEIGYLDGVTSAIQTQIDSKSPTESPTFTGTVTVPNGSILGTPTSVTLTNATGLPVSTGISGLGTGVATFLATPTSANLASAVTGETGSGALVFGSSPTLKGPIYLQSAGGAGGSANYIDVNGSNGTLSLVSGYPLALTATGNITLTATGGAAKVGSDTIATLTATQTLTGKIIDASSNTLSNIANSSLTNSKVTVGSTDVSLGGTVTSLAGLTSVTSTSFVGSLTGNASTVTNGVYTTDTGTVTNGMLAGSISNTKLANSEITINGTAVALGGSIQGLAPLSSPAFTGTPTAPTQAAGDNSTNIATTAYADAAAASAAAAIVDSAPGALNTLNELAAAINDDASYAATITTALGNKQDKITGVSDTEIAYLGGVTSAIQTQLDAKLSSTTAASTYQTIVSGVSNTEIGYLDGVTSAIQTQLNAKAVYPTQANNSGKYLSTDGNTTYWSTVDALPSQANNSGLYLTTDGNTASWSTVTTLPDQGQASGKFLTSNGQVASWSTVRQVPDYGQASGQFLTTDGNTTYWTAIDLSSKQDVVLGVSNTEIGYLDGVTSAIQTQLDAKIAKSLIDAKGDLLVGTADNTVARLAIGTDGFVLTANSSKTNGLSWSSISVPITTKTASIISNTATAIDSISETDVSVEYTLVLKQISPTTGSKIRSSKILVNIMSGFPQNTVDMSEFAITESGGSMSGVTISAIADSSGITFLEATVTDAASTTVDVKLSKVVL